MRIHAGGRSNVLTQLPDPLAPYGATGFARVGSRSCERTASLGLDAWAVHVGGATAGPTNALGATGNMDGGGGHDTLIGGTGPDTFTDGDVAPGHRPEVGDDYIDGRGGQDTVSYSERSARVVVDLRRGVGGQGRERDRLHSIESATGGSGDDLLRALDYPSWLIGRGGNDTLIGSRFDDYLLGNAGNDRL